MNLHYSRGNAEAWAGVLFPVKFTKSYSLTLLHTGFSEDDILSPHVFSR